MAKGASNDLDTTGTRDHFLLGYFGIQWVVVFVGYCDRAFFIEWVVWLLDSRCF